VQYFHIINYAIEIDAFNNPDKLIYILQSAILQSIFSTSPKLSKLPASFIPTNADSTIYFLILYSDC